MPDPVAPATPVTPPATPVVVDPTPKPADGDALYKTTAELVAAKEELKKMQDAQAAKDKEPVKDNPLIGTVDRQIDADRKTGIENSAIEEAVKFNLSVNEFIEKNNAFLPESTAQLVKTIQEKGMEYGDAKTMANATRHNILDNFFRFDENVKEMPEYAKDRIMDYLKLNAEERKRSSAKYWDLLQISLDRKALVNKSKQAGIANGMLPGGNDQVSYNDRFFQNTEKRIIK